MRTQGIIEISHQIGVDNITTDPIAKDPIIPEPHKLDKNVWILLRSTFNILDNVSSNRRSTIQATKETQLNAITESSNNNEASLLSCQ